MEQNSAKGSGFLKVTGILMIIGGAIALIVAIIAIVGIGAVVAMAETLEVEVSSGMLWVAGIVSLISAIAEFVTGIVGVKNCKNPAKANSCMVWGIIVAVLSVLGCILTAAGGNGFPVFSLILGLVLPVLFIIGAAMNKKAN